MEFIDLKNFNGLRVGNIVKHKTSYSTYVVTSNYGERVTAVKAVDITNANEWQVLNEAIVSEVRNCETCGHGLGSKICTTCSWNENYDMWKSNSNEAQ